MIDIFLFDTSLKRIKLEELAKHASSRNKKIWIDIINPVKDEFKKLKEIFKLHPLTVEDCLKKGRTRVKIERFDDYLFVVIYGISDTKRLYELDFIIGRNFVISNHFEAVESFNKLKRNDDKISTIMSRGPDFILHKLIDLEIDRYLELLAKYEDIIEKLEKNVLEEPNQQLVSRIFKLRKTFMRIRRIANLQKEKLLELAREKYPFISERLRPYFRDVFDHMLAVTETITIYREQLSGALELYLSTSSNKTNEVMKTLTVIASIMLPLSLIAGIYGMNFDNLPELHWKYGYTFALSLMAAVAIGLLFYFKRKGWF